jgi:hypothetical protein
VLTVPPNWGGIGVAADELCLKQICGGETSQFDLVFIHGLQGDPIGTWSIDGTDADASYWPKWLGSEFPAFRIFVLGYPAQIFVSWAKKDKEEMTLFERAKTALEYLASEDIGTRPIALVAHSLGGLLVKQMMRTASDGNDDGWSAVLQNVRLIAFIATPHTGASLAGLLHKFATSFSSTNVQMLSNSSGHLDELNEAYREITSRHPLRTLAYYEKQPYLNAIWVDQQSANPGISGTSPFPLEFNHVTCCKPKDRDALVHRSISRHLKELFPTEVSAATKLANGHAFKIDDYTEQSSDRRDLLQKLIDAGREAEYGRANELQNVFAQEYYRLGLFDEAKTANDKLLSDVEQRFTLHIYQNLICNDAADDDIAIGIQKHVIDPICATAFASGDSISPTAVYRAIYFLTQQCHLSWNIIK